ncbi:glycosyltransferase family 2 protein [Balneola sp. MJW-20]|uniref:glycosyltransferase family 2 protein n=1 Tax=Gracilimonas aurantiaca TaxID=3234185 RepID=UPI003465ECD7
MNDLISYWAQEGASGFTRIFWFYMIFELPRYILMDYALLLVYTIKTRFGEMDYKSAREEFFSAKPFLSVIVPGKNEGNNYYQLVKSLENQTYRNFELIIVDDGSDDHSELIGRSLERQGKIDLFISQEDRGGKASAANTALRYTRGEFIIHLDADSSLKEDALEEIMIPFYMDSKIGAVGGNLEVRNPGDSLSTTLQKIEYNIFIMVGRMVSSSLGILRIVSGAFGAFRKEALDKVGGWDIGPGLDGDITLKIRKLGYKIHFEPKATIFTSVPNTFMKLAKQRLRWSRSLVRFRLRKHKNLFMPFDTFDMANFISVAENIFFNFILNFLWYIYMVDIIFNFTNEIFYIIITGFILYSFSKVLQYIVVLILSKDWKDKLKYVIYLPGMVLYTGYFMRFVRTAAYIKELFFKASFKDNWNPAKTSEQGRLLEERIDQVFGKAS